MKKTNQLKAGIILSYLNMGISFVIPMLYTPVMLRWMGQGEYGLYHLSNSVTGYLGLLSLGMGNAILRYLMKFHTAGDRDMFCRTAGLFQAVYSVMAVAAVLAGVALTCFTGTLFAQGLTAQELNKMNVLLLIMATGTGISFLSSIYTGIIYCHEHHVFQKVTGIASTITLPCLNLVALYFGFASVGLAVINLVLALLFSLLNAWYCKKKLGVMPRFDHIPWHLLLEIVPFSLFVLLSMVADMLFWAVDKVLIGAIMGTTAVAVYNIGVTFQSIMQSLNGAISGVFAPRVNALVFSGKPVQENSALLIRVGRIQYLILSLIVSGFLVFGKQFLALWAGPGYEEAYPVALMTMIPMTIPLIQNVAFNTILAMNRHRFRSVIYSIMAVLNATSTFLVIPVLGVSGAALCTCLAVVLGQGIIMNIYYHRVTGLDIPAFWRNIGKMSLVPGGMVLAGILLAKHILPMTSLWWFLGWVIAYTVIFVILSWFISMNPYEKELVLGLLRKVMPRKETK